MATVYVPRSIERLHTLDKSTPVRCIGSPYPVFKPCEERISTQDELLQLAFQRLRTLEGGIQFHGAGLIETLAIVARGFSCKKIHREMDGQTTQLPYYWLALDSLPAFVEHMGHVDSICSPRKIQRNSPKRTRNIRTTVNIMGTSRVWLVYKAMSNLNEQWWSKGWNGDPARYFMQILRERLNRDNQNTISRGHIEDAEKWWSLWEQPSDTRTREEDNSISQNPEGINVESDQESGDPAWQFEDETENPSTSTYSSPEPSPNNSPIRSSAKKTLSTPRKTHLTPQRLKHRSISTTPLRNGRSGCVVGGSLAARTISPSPSPLSDELPTRLHNLRLQCIDSRAAKISGSNLSTDRRRSAIQIPETCVSEKLDQHISPAAATSPGNGNVPSTRTLGVGPTDSLFFKHFVGKPKDLKLAVHDVIAEIEQTLDEKFQDDGSCVYALNILMHRLDLTNLVTQDRIASTDDEQGI